MTTEQISRHFIATEDVFCEDLLIDFETNSLPIDTSVKISLFDPNDLKNSFCLLLSKYDDLTILAALFDDKVHDFKKDHTTTIIRSTKTSVFVRKTPQGVCLELDGKLLGSVNANIVKLIVSVWSDDDVERDFQQNVRFSRCLKEDNRTLADVESNCPKTPNNTFVRRELLKRQMSRTYNIRIFVALSLLTICLILIIGLSVTSSNY